MGKIKVGILRENKIPPDRRVPLLPDQCLDVMKQYPDVSFYIQPSDIRCFSNREYTEVGLVLREDLSECDILLGIKEVPPHLLIPNKKYLFFSHTIKKQPHNQKLLQTIIQKKITLIDYECLTNQNGERIIAFGRFAGIVGAYNAILLYGKKFNLFKIKPAHHCFDLEEVYKELQKVTLPKLKITVTGGGRVAKGALEILDYLNIKRVAPEEFLSSEEDRAVYVHLRSKDYHVEKSGKTWNPGDFYSHPENYTSTFSTYLDKTDILIAGAYWDPKAPVLFTKEDMQKESFRIKMIADITCDINGSIPSTIKPTTIYDPAYDYNPLTHELEAPFSQRENVTVMAIDNLPGELPRDASRDFGNQLINNVFPHLFNTDNEGIILKGTIAANGQLTPNFEYLSDYSKGL